MAVAWHRDKTPPRVQPGAMSDLATVDAADRSWRAAMANRLRAVVARLLHYRRMSRERAQLLALTERERRDIGISRLDAIREAQRPFWR